MVLLDMVLAHSSKGLLFRRSTIPKVRVRVRVRVKFGVSMLRVSFRVRVNRSKVSRVRLMVSKVMASGASE